MSWRSFAAGVAFASSAGAAVVAAAPELVAPFVVDDTLARIEDLVDESLRDHERTQLSLVMIRGILTDGRVIPNPGELEIAARDSTFVLERVLLRIEDKVDRSLEQHADTQAYARAIRRILVEEKERHDREHETSNEGGGC